jgi:endonuclease-3 related protein
MVGAILTQNTNWSNVEKAIAGLKREGALSPQALAQMTPERLQQTIRSAGYFRQKSVRLQRLAQWVMERAGGDLNSLDGTPTEDLREELLALRGIGPETADSILLYALDRPTFVVDTYTKRVVLRHQLLDEECTYHDLKELFEDALPADLELLRDYHAQIVELGKRYCRPRPRCAGCPAAAALGAPVLEDW